MANGTIQTSGWKYVGTATGANTVALPSNYSEFIVEVRYTTSAIHFNFSVCRLQLDATPKLFTAGYYNGSTASSICQISISDSSVYLLAIYINGQNYTSTSSIRVFAR